MGRSRAWNTFLFLGPMVLFFLVLNVLKSDRNEEQYVIPADDLVEIKRLGLVNSKDNEIYDIVKRKPDDQTGCDCSQINEIQQTKDKDETLFASALTANQKNSMHLTKNDQPLPTIFVITPTYLRPTQMPDLTRLAQTLMLVKNVFWIVIEDAKEYNKQVRDLLLRTKLPYAHLLGPRPPTHMDKRSGRGVSNRLKALQWLRQKYSNTTKSGVLYFADDDNSYDIRVFDEMRYTQKVSVFPVGMLAKTGISSPIVKAGKIVGFHDPWYGNRIFAVDMAGFAVNLQYFLSNPKATMPYKVGYEEDFFIRSLGAELDDLEPKAKNCTEVYVWHTKTQTNPFPSPSNIKNVNSENLELLYNNILNTKLD